MTAHFEYQQTGKSTELNAMGMREMQARAFEKRHSQYLLIKAPPASGKSRALMFLALDKLYQQGLRKAIIAIPQMSIGGSFANTPLSHFGFFKDWEILPQNNLCQMEMDEKSKVQAFKRFMQQPDERILLCTHSTLRFATEQLDATEFNDCLISIDEFHHVSAHEDNKLGERLDKIMQQSNAHIIAMTGSYFRGDAMPILTPEDELKFDTVVYTYYEQLNGYRYLKSIDLGYHFYIGSYFDNALSEVLDLTKKTIIHIPNVNSAESTKNKYDEVDRILDIIGDIVEVDPNTNVFTLKTVTGKLLKVADLVNDDPEVRSKTLAYLRNIKQADEMDIIIALNMAKEGFDWTFCEHALTIGYRSSLTEVVQIIGRATRDCIGKTSARFTNLIAQPDAENEDVKNAVNNLLKAITLSLLMEQVLAPNITFRRRSEVTENETLPVGTVIVDDTVQRPSDRVMKILNGGKEEIMAALLQQETKAIMTNDVAPETLSEVLLPQVIKQRYPDLNEQEIEQVQVGMLQAMTIGQLGGVVNGEDLPEDAVIDGVAEPSGEYVVNKQFVKMGERFIDIEKLDLDLIQAINPFQNAYEILSKSVTPEMLKTIQSVASVSKIAMTEQEALMLWQRIQDFMRKNNKEPSLTANYPLEKRMAEAIIWLRNEKRKRLSQEQ
ncbi:DEAD/DEAH box helicase [Lonepinella sp. BR2919]|uniref:DEAD/DEAH box helicase n=1 Tax=unclassified Lonepinella TaxID=2642006 RepID=UPI003F6E0FB8